MAPQGLHARPATTLIKLVKAFNSVVSLQKAEKTVRLDSLLKLMSLTIKGGETVSITIEGEDEVATADALDLFFTEKLKDL